MMLEDWNFLSYSTDPELSPLNDLKAWLRSQTQDSHTTVSPTSHSLLVLRVMLQAAINEITDTLDEQISLLVVEADDFDIQVRQGEYYKSRPEDWDAVLPTDVDEMGAEECVGLLRAAKEEIAWLVNEISRLQCYIRVEKELYGMGEMGRRTRLRPLPRKDQGRGGRGGGDFGDPMEVDDDEGRASPVRFPSLELWSWS